ncbi:MAG: 50S ribosomal protein L25/general stress protein Ctc [Gammaproteobacteria bacterium]|nr:MAG: 50S ribosomal protein L25/general stress protein Ctc [Gammaproteobacteria bacterium]
MSNLVVEAELREETGRSAARRLRRAGKIPGIIYGGDKPDLPIAMDYFKISRLLEDEQFHTSMLEVKVKGSRGKNTVLLKDTQWDPVKDTIVHVDFFRVSAKDAITTEVPLVAVNYEKCPGIVAGGVLETIRHALEISCRADSIPEHIEIDCSNLEIGDAVHIRDIPLPEGVTVPEIEHDEELNFTLLTIAAPRVEEKAEEAEAPEAAAAEGAEAASGE